MTRKDVRMALIVLSGYIVGLAVLAAMLLAFG